MTALFVFFLNMRAGDITQTNKMKHLVFLVQNDCFFYLNDVTIPVFSTLNGLSFSIDQHQILHHFVKLLFVSEETKTVVSLFDSRTWCDAFNVFNSYKKLSSGSEHDFLSKHHFEKIIMITIKKTPKIDSLSNCKFYRKA